MAPQNLPPNQPNSNITQLFARFIIEHPERTLDFVVFSAKCGDLPTARAAALLVRAEVEKQLDKQQPPQQQLPHLTETEALCLAAAACQCLLTGSPALSSFGLPEVTAARVIMQELAFERLAGTSQADTLRKAWLVLGKIQNLLKGDNRPGGPQRRTAQTVLDGLAVILADQERDGGDYWRSFTDDALAEIDSILAGDE